MKLTSFAGAMKPEATTGKQSFQEWKFNVETAATTSGTTNHNNDIKRIGCECGSPAVRIIGLLDASRPASSLFNSLIVLCRGLCKSSKSLFFYSLFGNMAAQFLHSLTVSMSTKHFKLYIWRLLIFYYWSWFLSNSIFLLLFVLLFSCARRWTSSSNS